MKTSVIALLLSAALGMSPSIARGQDTEDATAPDSAQTEVPGRQVYTPTDFARFAPSNALDMLRQVPGFSIISQDQGRGLGQASDNVLIDGERVASKSDSLFDTLSRISADRVERIEIVDGATFGIPGLSGQVANVVTRAGGIGGRFEYRAIARPKYAKPSYGGGEVSISGSGDRLEWTAAFSHGVGRGGAGGGDGAFIYDRFGNLLERRDVLIRFVGEFPRLSGSLKWTAPSGLVANLHASYSREYTTFIHDEFRDLTTGVDRFRDFTNEDDGYGYEIGGDLEFALGPGRLKLIGLENFERAGGPATSVLVFEDGSPSVGSQFDQTRESGERIGRAEYRWAMLGGDWQLDAEAAFNRFHAVATLAFLEPSGEFVAIPFPEGTGGVTEDRYESILTHNRTLASGLTMQLGMGGEYSKLSQTGSGGLTRRFWRPKGSLTFAWTPRTGVDLSFKLARTVGQLSFGDFLASVNLSQDNQNAGNVELVPQQAWEADLELTKNFGAWGSATIRSYARLIEDYIDIIPVIGGESRGNIHGNARLLGMSGNATINFDPLGWGGAKLTANATVEDSDLKDPLTSLSRPFSNHTDYRGEVNLRYDIPQSDWALGGGFSFTHRQPYVRLFETGIDYEGPIYTSAFIEHKDLFGLTVNLNVFNLTAGQGFFRRTVYAGLRDRSPILFVEDRKTDVSTIFRLTVKGSF